MSVIRGLLVNAGVQALVSIVLNLVGDAGLRVSQVGKNGPLAACEHVGFEARPPAFSLGIIVAVAAAALRALGLVVAQQVPVHVTAVLPAAVGVHEQTGRGRLGPKSTLPGRGNQLLGHGGQHVLSAAPAAPSPPPAC